ncbi:MAG: hypothetical protein Q9213_005213 [Squamulea squamosa]
MPGGLFITFPTQKSLSRTFMNDTQTFKRLLALMVADALLFGVKSDVYFANMGVVKGKLAPTLFSSTDPKWHKNVRKAVNPFFTVSAVTAYEAYVEKTIRTFVREMDQRFADRDGPDGSVDLHSWLEYYAFDSISELTYSKPLGFTENGRDMLGIIGWVASFLKYGFIVSSLDDLVDTFSIDYNIYRVGIYNGVTFPGAAFALKRIEERKSQKFMGKGDETREDLLDKFLRAGKERPDIISDQEVLGLSLSMIIAGAETSAISLTAIFYYLLRTPGCYSKLEAELFDQLKPSSLTADMEYLPTRFSESIELPYLNACIREAFRMHPALGMLTERIVPSPGRVICGEFIPGGTLVGSNPWVEQRDKTVFGEDSDVYRPERWLENEEKRHGMERAMFNFGAGNHVCMGQNIARMNIFKLVPTLIRTYEVILATPQELASHSGRWSLMKRQISMEDPEKEWTIVNGANMKQTDFNVRLRKREAVQATIFEREGYLNQRPRDWNFGVFWAQEALNQCLPSNLQSRLADARVDPVDARNYDNTLPIFNAESGDLLIRQPTPGVLRLRRSAFRQLIAEGLDIQVSILASTVDDQSHRWEELIGL